MLLNRYRSNAKSSSAARTGTGRTRARFQPRLEALEDRCLMNAKILENFPNINFQDSGGFTPPDTQMAVGPSAVVGAVNTAITLIAKNGKVLSPPEQFSTFFASIFTAGDTFSDPFVLFDDMAQRFYLCVLEIPSDDTKTTIDFAVSTSANPTDLSSANWTIFPKITSANQGGTALPDFPKMGFNNEAVFISTNQFSATAFTGNLILAISKDSILAGGPLVTFQTFVDTGSDTRIMMPARMHNATGNVEFFVQKDNEATSTVNVIAETGYLTNAPTFATTTLTVNAYQQSPGVRDLTNQIDDRILSVDWINNEMVAAGNVGLSDGLNHSRWYLFSTAGTPTVLQQGDISIPGLDTWYPSIALNAGGDIAMTFGTSGNGSDTNFPSMDVTGRTPFDPANSMEVPVQVIAGLGHLASLRGGDYSATEFDPSDPANFWSSQQYAFDNSGDNFHWGTQIAEYTLVSPLTKTKPFHPFRYIVPETDDTLFIGNITIINFAPDAVVGANFAIVIPALPDGVTLDASVQTVPTSTGAPGIPLPTTGIPAQIAIRVEIKLRNPNHVPISTFFEGFEVDLVALS